MVVGSGGGKSGSDQVADEMDEVQRMLGSKCGLERRAEDELLGGRCLGSGVVRGDGGGLGLLSMTDYEDNRIVREHGRQRDMAH